MEKTTNFSQNLQVFYQKEQLLQKEKSDPGYVEELLSTMENGIHLVLYPSKVRQLITKYRPIPFQPNQITTNLLFVYKLHCFDLFELYQEELPEETHLQMMKRLEECVLESDYRHFYEEMQELFTSVKRQHLQREMVKK